MAGEYFQSESEGEFLVEIEPKVSLTKDEAALSLNCVGPTFRIVDEGVNYSFCAYAYVAMDVVGRNLTDVSVLPFFVHVMFLDVSMNRLTDDSFNALAGMEKLIILMADNNRIETAVIPTFPQLQILSLKQNRITTCRVNSQPELEFLELAGNNIRELRPGFWGPKKLPKLKELGLRDNGLVSSAGINFPTLVSLFLADNDITVLRGLEKLPNLKFLHLRNNPLQSLDGFSKIMDLVTPNILVDKGSTRLLTIPRVELRSLKKTLKLGCKIKNVKELKKLSVLPRLERIVVLDNPFTQTTYRIQAIAMIPKLRKIDKTLVEKNEKKKANRLAKKMMEIDEEDEEVEGEEEEEDE